MARLIIVEDNQELASLIASALRTRGHTSLAIYTGQAALEALALQSVDGAIVDLLLPDMAGTQVLAELKLRAVPSIAVSGVFKGSRFVSEALDQYGAKAFFDKPFEMNALLDTVDQLVGPPTLHLTAADADEDSLEELAPLDDAEQPRPPPPPKDEPQRDEPLGLVTAPPEPPVQVTQPPLVTDRATPFPKQPVATQPVADEELSPHDRPTPIPKVPGGFDFDPNDDLFNRPTPPPPPVLDEEPSTRPGAESFFDTPTAIPRLPDVEEDDDPLAKTRDLEPKDPPLAAKAPDLEPDDDPLAKTAASFEPDDDPLAKTAASFEPEDDPLAKTRYILPSAADKILAEEAGPVVPVQPEPASAAAAGERPTPPEPPREPVAAKPAEPAPSTAAEPASSAEPKPKPEARPAGPPAASEPAAARSEPVLTGFAFGDRDKGRAKPDAAATKPAPGAGNEPAGGETGDLGSTSVPRLLTAYYQARHDGELKLRQGNVLKVVYFSKGQPIYAASNLASERFGRLCVRKGLLTQAKLDEVAKSAKEQNQRTAELLLKQNLLTPEQRKELLEEQVREIIWSTFGWTQGEYAFVPKRPPAAGLVKLSVFPGNLIMEGVQRTETLVSLRKKVPGDRRYMPTSDPPYELHEITLSGAQAMLLAYADGTKTVEDLLSLTELPVKDALATLAGLELLGLIQERREDNRSKRISFGL